MRSRASKVSCSPHGLTSDKTSCFRSSYCARSSLARIGGLRKVVRIAWSISNSDILAAHCMFITPSDRKYHSSSQKKGTKEENLILRLDAGDRERFCNLKLYLDSAKWRNEAKNPLVFETSAHSCCRRGSRLIHWTRGGDRRSNIRRPPSRDGAKGDDGC